MKTAMQKLLEVLERNAKNIQPMDIDDIIRLIELDYIQIEKQQIKNAFCAGWDKSKTALMPNKKNHYSEEYLNKKQDENN